MTLNKKLVDEAIRLNKKYFREGVINCLEELYEAEKKAFGDNKSWIALIINGITVKNEKCNEPYETYYKVLEVLGFKVVEDEKEN